MPMFPGQLMNWFVEENSFWVQLNVLRRDTVDLMDTNGLNYDLHIWLLWNYCQRNTPTPVLPSKMAVKDLIGEFLTIKRMLFKVGIDK